MTTTHTPGPWFVSPRCDVKTRDHFTIAQVNDRIGTTYGHSSPNARLIAAAPDLLAALEAVVTNWSLNACAGQKPGPWSCEHVVRAAIAKARGQQGVEP